MRAGAAAGAGTGFFAAAGFGFGAGLGLRRLDLRLKLLCRGKRREAAMNVAEKEQTSLHVKYPVSRKRSLCQTPAPAVKRNRFPSAPGGRLSEPCASAGLPSGLEKILGCARGRT